MLTPLVIIAIVVTILSWASAFIVIRGTGPYFSGGALALGRLAVGAFLLAIVYLVRRKDAAYADSLHELGMTLFTIGISGPYEDLSKVEEWLRWRDDKNA